MGKHQKAEMWDSSDFQLIISSHQWCDRQLVVALWRLVETKLVETELVETELFETELVETELIETELVETELVETELVADR